MMQWTTNRVDPAVAARTAMPGMTRQSTTTAPIGSRGQFRSRDMPQRNAPAQRGAIKADKDDDEDEWPEDKEPLFGRGEDDDDDGLDDGNTNPNDENPNDEQPDDDQPDDEKKSVKG